MYLSDQDLEFMGHAIEEAKLCRPEDERPHPAVGAIIVRDRQVLARAHRGEDLPEEQPGAHAEYIAIKKAMAEVQSENLTGAILYTTLEPCTWRGHPNRPCAEWIVDAGISRVWVGILDPNPIIYEQGVWYLKGHGVPVEHFPASMQSAIEGLEANRRFIAEERKELRAILTRHEVMREKFRSPTSLTAQERSHIFPYSLDGLPHPFVDVQSRCVDVLFVVGPTRYDLEICKGRFTRKGNVFVDTKLGVGIVLGESAHNVVLGSEIVATLSNIAGVKGFRMETEGGRAHLTYIDVDDDMLARHNILCVPCGDVNPVVTKALMRFEMRYKVRCPVHHQPYESSEAIKSEITGSLYEKEGGAEEWAGYVLLLPNPWNEKKAFLICGGNKGVGTQGALLRVLKAMKGEAPLGNRAELPGRVVKAEYDRATLRVTDVFEVE